MTSVAVELAPPALWRDVVALLKLRIDALVVCVALASAVAAGARSPLLLAALAVACLAASAGASALNHYLDRDVDARMPRTRSRPVAAGRIDPRVALWLGVGLIAGSQLLVPVLGPVASLYLLAGAVTYAGVYTWWLKPRTPYSIVLGGAAGSFAALAGWQTAASTVHPAPLLLAAVLFLWTPSHFWSLAIVLEQDYRQAGLPMLSAIAGPRRTAEAVFVNTLALVAASLALAVFFPWPYAAVAAPAGAAYLACTHALRLRGDIGWAWRSFKLSGLYLLALLFGLVLSTLV